MGWSYRAMKHVDESGDVWYGMHEYFVLDEGPSWTDDHMRPMGESVEVLKGELQLMLADLERYPVLDYRTGEEVLNGSD